MADLVITDLMMPETNGLELVAAVRQLYPQVPVILMTAYGNESIAVEALERGAASYVPKSQQADRLSDTVAACWPAWTLIVTKRTCAAVPPSWIVRSTWTAIRH